MRVSGHLFGSFNCIGKSLNCTTAGVFTLSDAGNFTVIKSFTTSDGSKLSKGLIDGGDGWIYSRTVADSYSCSSSGECGILFHSWRALSTLDESDIDLI